MLYHIETIGDTRHDTRPFTPDWLASRRCQPSMLEAGIESHRSGHWPMPSTVASDGCWSMVQTQNRPGALCGCTGPDLCCPRCPALPSEALLQRPCFFSRTDEPAAVPTSRVTVDAASALRQSLKIDMPSSISSAETVSGGMNRIDSNIGAPVVSNSRPLSWHAAVTLPEMPAPPTPAN